ncbi:MAG: cohesin domain-containing protein [Desulfobacterales bacterium]
MRKQYVSVLIFTALIIVPVFTQAEPVVQISMENPTLKPGEITTADLRIRDIPPVYGAEMILTFDPNILEVADEDKERENIQIRPGKFFDLSHSHFPLQNQADNRTGRIYYAVSMLNPAPEAQGDGTLAHIAFRAKAPGDANLKMETAKFGTRDGRTVIPDTAPPVQIQVRNRTGNWQGFALTVSAALLIFAGMIYILGKRKKT